MREVIPVALGVLLFGILGRSKRVGTLLEEVVSELRKVTWPKREEVTRSTVVVVVCILICGSLLGVFDMVWGKLITTLLHSSF